MIETKIPEIDVEELMEKIRAEVKLRKINGNILSGTIPSGDFSSQSCPSTRTDLTGILSIPEPEKFEIKDHYHINDFLKYHDEQFVINAYHGILRRRSDSEGSQYFLENLRVGKMTKAEILGRLRYSPEGRSRKVKIRGLFWNFVIQSSFNIPVLGYPSRLIFGIGNLPLIIRNIQTLERNTVTQIQQQKNHLTTVFIQLGLELERKADRQELEGIYNQIQEILRQIRDHKLNILDQQRRLMLLLEEARKRFPDPISTDQLKVMLTEKDHILDAMYASFEEKFRGTRKDIQQKLKIYLPYIRNVGAGTAESPILDLGCGRGEWLELLRDESLMAKGIDINRVFLEVCRDSDLDIAEQDAVTYLQSLRANSVGVITAFHLIEHLPTNTLIELLDESLRVLRPGGLVIFETPNPKNVLVGSCYFYMDPTHQRPLPSPLCEFLLENRGFVDLIGLDLHPFENSIESIEGNEKTIEVVNQYLFGPRDFAIIGKKA